MGQGAKAEAGKSRVIHALTGISINQKRGRFGYMA